MNDVATIRAVVYGMISIACLGLVGSLILTALGKPVPGEVIAVAAGAAGGLGSILARTSTAPGRVDGVDSVDGERRAL